MLGSVSEGVRSSNPAVLLSSRPLSVLHSVPKGPLHYEGDPIQHRVILLPIVSLPPRVKIGLSDIARKPLAVLIGAPIACPIAERTPAG